MAYYDHGFMWPQEHTINDPSPYQDSVSFSTYEPYDLDTKNDAYILSEYHEPKFMHHYNDYGYGYYQNLDHSPNFEINYFAHSYMKPELIMYEPVACDTGYVSYHTQYSISYSEMDSGFNEPEFEEYDPTPYGGGYDIISVYGKPLPPSDQTCYPHSNPKPINPEPKAKLGAKPELLPEPKPEPMPLIETMPKHEPNLPKPEPKPKPKSKPEPVPELKPIQDPVDVDAVVPVAEPLGLREEGKRDSEEYSYPVYGYDYPWPEYDRGNGIEVGSYDYEYGKHVVQIPPCEYDRDVVELCENIFGNWPCLARIRKQQMGNDSAQKQTGTHDYSGIACSEFGRHNPWEECANFLFGSSMVSYNQ